MRQKIWIHLIVLGLTSVGCDVRTTVKLEEPHITATEITFSGVNKYQLKAVLDGKGNRVSEAWSKPDQSVISSGQYQDDQPWNGTFVGKDKKKGSFSLASYKEGRLQSCTPIEDPAMLQDIKRCDRGKNFSLWQLSSATATETPQPDD